MSDIVKVSYFPEGCFSKEESLFIE